MMPIFQIINLASLGWRLLSTSLTF